MKNLYQSGFATPLIRKRRSKLTPWDLYQRIDRQGNTSFFLDSIRYQPPAQRYSYLGWRPYQRVLFSNQRLDSIHELRELFQNVRVPPGYSSDFFSGGAVGYWSYELAEDFESVSFRRKKGPHFPKLELLFFRDVIVFDHSQEIYYLVSWLIPQKGISFDEAHRGAEESVGEMEAVFSDTNENEKSHDFSLLHFNAEVRKPVFERMVRKAQSYIQAGDIYQANLSQRFSFTFEGSPLDLYGRLRQTNPSPYAAALHFGDLFIASSSPELLVAKKGRRCVTRPIAGTRPRGRRAGETKRLARELLASEKERAEHLMLVDLERNDLGRVSEWRSVKVKDFMRIEKYARVMHIVSEITGRLKPAKDAWDVIQAMFPGGTITGCPKIRSMQIIDELEPVQRGVYTGSIGWIGFNGDMMLNIAIRTLVLQGRRGYLQVGAGIVADSVPAREYDETLAKGEALAEALLEANIR